MRSIDLVVDFGGSSHLIPVIDIQQRPRSYRQAHDVHQRNVGEGAGRPRAPKLQRYVCVEDGSDGVRSVGEVPWGLNTKRTFIATGLLLIFDAWSYHRGSG